MLNSIGRRWVRLSAPVLSILVGATSAHATSPTCRDLGAATPYNAFVFGNFSAQSSDVEGRVAIGGNLSISNYSLADKLDAASAGNSVIVGGDFNFSSGRLYFGNAKVAGSAAGVAASVRSGLAPGQTIVDRTTLPIDFAAERSRLRQLSSDLAAIAANGTYAAQWGGLTLTGKANQTLQVFDLPGQLVLDAHTFTVQGIPSGATVLFNIRGSVAGLTDMSLESLASLRRRVVFNFPEATQLTLGGISVEGSILAPKAALQNPQGVIKGQLIAESWNGMMQINHEPFAGCLGSTAPSNRPPVIVSSPATVTVAGRPYLYDVDATDPDGDTLVYARPIGPQGSTLQSSSGVLQWTPTIQQIGVHPIKVSATDPAGAAAQQSYDLRVVQDFCEIYPIALPHAVMDPLAPGAIVNEMPRGMGAGNYSWLSWTGANDAPTLATSLVPPGDSWRYVDPDDATDKLLSIGDYAQGGPGSMNASAVRDAMDVLKTRDIILPVWDAKRGQGSKFDYRVQRFVTVRLRDYRLTGNGWISFEYKGPATCYGSVPQAMPQTLVTDENVAMPIVLQGTDADGDALSYQVVTAPVHGALIGTAPNLTYTPAAGYHGLDTFTFKVNDGRSDSAAATVSINVRPVNDAPVANSQQINTDEDASASTELTGSDADGDMLAYTIVSGPTHGALSGTAPQLTYTPHADFHGSDVFTFLARDGSLSSTPATVSITVRPRNDAPSAQSQLVQTNEAMAVSIVLVASDADGDALSFTVVSQPANGTLSGIAPNLVYSPANGFDGADDFTFRVSDGELESTIATVSIAVQPVNGAPAAQSQHVETAEGTPLAIILTGTDPDGDALTYDILAEPAHGSISGTAPNLEYTPATGYDGADSFTFRVSDGILASASATVSITVRPVNAAPSAQPQQVETSENTPIVILLSGTDPDGDALSYTILSEPEHGTLDGAAPTLEYTPTADYDGIDAFTFRVSDGELDSVSAMVSINVRAVNSAPSANPQQLETAEDTPLQLVLTGSDADGDELTYAVVSPPAHGRLEGNGSHLVFTPDDNYHGSDLFTFRTDDGTQASDEVDVSITVTPVNDPPYITSAPALVANAGATYHYLATALDPDQGDELGWSLVTAPQGMNVDQGSGVVTWTPTVAQVGTHAITLQVRDVAGAFDRQEFALRVGRENKAPQIISDPVETAVEGLRYRYDVDAADPDGDTLTYALARAPQGMSIASDSGAIDWQAPGTLSRGLIEEHTACKVSLSGGSSRPDTVDLITLVDRSGSMDTEMAWVAGMIPTLEAELLLNEIGVQNGNRYGLIDFDHFPRAFDLDGAPWGGHVAFSRAAKRLRVGDQSFGEEDGFLAIHFALQTYSFRTNVPRNLLFITDEGRLAQDGTLTRAVITEELQEHRVMLNAVLNINLRCGDGREALGLGQGGVGYVADAQGGYSLCSGAHATGGNTNTVTEYLPLALSTGGAAWDLNYLRAGGVAAESFSRALIDIKVREIEGQVSYTPRSDLVPLAIQYLEAVESIPARARVTVRNRGLVASTPAEVLLKATGAVANQSLGSRSIVSLAPGSEATFVFDLPGSVEAADSLSAQIESAPESDCEPENDELSTPLVRTTASDPFGASDIQTFAVTVAEQGDAPGFLSTPSALAYVGFRYAYRAQANDPDRGDAVTYRLTQSPAGMDINEVSGQLSFLPSAAQAGQHPVRIVAIDLQGMEAVQAFTLTVGHDPTPVLITSVPPSRATLGETWAYQPTIQGSTDHGFTLLDGPQGMQLDPLSGSLTWSVPANFEPGSSIWVLLVVTRSDGRYDTQIFEVFVDRPSDAPRITSTPVSRMTAGAFHQYDANAVDANVNDTQTWSLLSAPPGATINSVTGQLAWTHQLAAGEPIETPVKPDPYCRTPLSTNTTLAPRAVWQWTGATDAGMPIAARLSDTNQDGVVDEHDTPSLAVVAVLPSPTRVGLAVLDAVSGQLRWTYIGLPLEPYASPAAADLDGDGRDELLAVTSDRRIVAINADGSQRWVSDQVPVLSLLGSSLAAADLDLDGRSEVLIGGDVYRPDGQLRWRFNLGLPLSGRYSETALAVDLRGDERLELVFWDQMRDANGNLLQTLTLPDEIQPETSVAWSAGNLDGDGALELLAYSYQKRHLYGFDNDGSVLFPRQVIVGPANSARGAPLVADFDGDGSNEIFLPGIERLYEADGRWTGLIGLGSGRGGAFAADLDRDGAMDLVAHDGDGASIYAGVSSVRASVVRYIGDSVRVQPPILVDVAGEGWMFAGGQGAVKAWRASSGAWPPPLRPSSQLTHVPSDAYSEPLFGTYGQLTELGHEAIPLPDVWVGNLQVAEAGAGFEVSVDVINRGRAAIPQPLTLRLHAGDPDAGGVLLRDIDVPPLPVAQERTIRHVVMDPAVLRDRLYAAIASPSGGECETRNNRVSARYFALQVADHTALTDIQRYALQLTTSSRLHAVSSTPVLSATETVPYAYQVRVTDTDPIERFSYVLTTAPVGAGIDNTTGLISWIPRRGQAGTHRFVVSVTDLDGLPRNQTFDVGVSAGPNTAPNITSTPSTTAHVGRTYAYVVQAQDAEGDPITYSLEQAAPGMQFDAAAGRVSWTPTATGEVQIRVAARDDRGGRSEQSFNIVVGENRPPALTSTPPPFARVGQVYTHTATASDPDGDALAFALDSGPAGMLLTATGDLSWQPSAAQLGVHDGSLHVSDGLASAAQSFEVTVVAADAPPQLVIELSPSEPIAGQPIQVRVVAEQPGPVSLTLDGTTVPVVDGIATLLPQSIGTHTLVATDAGTPPTTTTVNFEIENPNAGAPIVAITAPAEHPDYDTVTITAPTEIAGSVHDDDLTRWELVAQDRNGGPILVLAQGTDTFDARSLATFDPTRLLNGQYQLRLTGWDATGRTATAIRTLLVDGDLKLGHYAITFEEVSIPVAGIPVTVTRTYDTRRRLDNGDFGYGWTVDASNMRVHESRRLGVGWSLHRIERGVIDDWCVLPNGDPIVSVTMPDGEVDRFRARAVPECLPVPHEDVNIAFTPIEGTDSQLSTGDYGTVRLNGSNLVDFGDPTFPPVDPTGYVLTTAEGVEYTVHQIDGLRRVEEPNGQYLTFSAAGVQHSSGVGIDFVRDSQGRIEQMQLPDGGTIDYVYDTSGDLIGLVDAADETAAFGYHPSFAHYLETIEDARGVIVSRNEYDADGKLIATIDADGHRIEYDHDLAGRTSRIKDRRGYTTTYVYNDRGDVLAETNALDETTRHTYDEDGNELTRTDALDRTTTWTYDARGNVLTETNHAGETTTRTYSAQNQLLTETDAAGVQTSDNLYAHHGLNLVSTTDALGNETTFKYDFDVGGSSTGQLDTITDAAGAVTSYRYSATSTFKLWESDAHGTRTTFEHDTMGRVGKEVRTRTLPNGSTETLTTTYDYDDGGRLTATTHPDGGVTTLIYDGLDQPSVECDALDRCTEHVYNDRGEEVETRHADATIETKVYDPNGNVIAQTDRGGRTTKFVYDEANRLTETIHPDADIEDGNDANNPRTLSRYDEAGQLVESEDELGRITRYEYDAAGRRERTVLAAVDGVTAEQVDSYDERGRRIATTDAKGATTRYVYDDAGRLTETIHPDATDEDGNDANNPRTRVEYDVVGRKVAEIDASGRITRYAYDLLGRLIAVALPNPETGANPVLVVSGAGATMTVSSPDTGVLLTRYGYDESGNKLTQTDAEGRTTRWEYDAMGRETARVLPEGQRETKRYNLAGELTEATDFEGKTTRYTYDDMGRAETIDYPNDPDVSFGYTPAGERDEVIDGRGTSRTMYDRRGRMLRMEDADGGVIEYTYDAAGNLESRISPSQSLTYVYDERHRLVEVTRTIDGEAPMVTAYEYDAVGNRQAMDGGDGIRTEYTYDRRHRLTQILKKTADGATLLAMTYMVDATGMRTAVEEADATGITRTVVYTYDGTKRLTNEAINHRQADRDRTISWTYDRVGNRLTQTLLVAGATETTDYTYDDNDRLDNETRSGAGSSATTYTYDDNGNTRTKSTGADSTTYAYDDANRLIDAVTGQGTTSYRYTADGLRIRQTHTPAGGTATTTWYVQDPVFPYANAVEHYEQQGTGPRRLSATFTFADDLVSQTRYAADGTPTTRFIHADGFGSTRWLTDVAGILTDSVDYDAYGNEVHRMGTTDIQHLYRGEAFDPNVGFYYLRARWMDPSSGRFLTQDTYMGSSVDPASLHKYLYANADPANGIDPSGHFTMSEAMSALRTMATNLTRGVSGMARTVARRVVTGTLQSIRAAGAQVRQCIRNIRKCKIDRPILVTGRSIPETADHILAAQWMLGGTTNRGLPRHTNLLPSQFRLNYSGTRNPVIYQASFACNPAARFAYGGPSACDEYPFATTRQGGPYNYPWRVSLRLVPGRGASRDEGQKQGTMLSMFNSACGLRPAPVQKSEFISVGAPDLPSMGICNGRIVPFF